VKLNAEKIKSTLNFYAEVLVYETIDSTNILAEKLAKEYSDPLLIVSESQTDGRGRNGKSFYSPSTGLYMSLVTHPDSDFYSMNTVTCGTSVAVVRAIENLTDLKPKIKWVNDIYVDNKKVCGILCRALGGNGRVEHLITGVGVNISTETFPDEIKDTAGSLRRKIDKNVLAAEIANNLIFVADYMSEYREKSCVIGQEITYSKNGVSFDAVAVDIDDNGGLIVFDGKEKATLTGGEITVRIKK